MNYIIRKSTLKDVDSVGQLFDLYRVFYEKESDIETAKRFITERMEQTDSEIYLAETSEGRAVGFTQLYPLFSSTRMKRLWLLNDLYVEKSFRGKGISKALIESAKQLAVRTNACGLLLETAITNTVGHQLYPSTGFEIQSDSNFYFWTNNRT
ncbi:MAG: GNAT family N-acetyltransferase [Bacteroidetes Order II. Incertae sedis bacterium]|nr:GNAT family N-acetyltransferase [Bacteroidetes Order II. bacterium]